MSTKKNHLLIDALFRKPVERTPIWMMRQAGRYLPEYQQLRKSNPDFMRFCKTPELAAEATLQPIERFPLDAAIVFSDILMIPDAMGADICIVPSTGPVIGNPITSMADLKQLHFPEAESELGYVYETIRLVKRELADRIPLIGFAGSPWTLACYMVEGKGSRYFHKTKAMLYQYPDIITALLKQLTAISIDYLFAQIVAGADVIMLFDTWGGLLTPSAYASFSLKYLSQIVHALKERPDTAHVPIIFFTKQSSTFLEAMAVAGCDAIGLDWTINVSEARRRVGDQVALQGNLDPAVLLANPITVQREVTLILNDYGPHPGHVFNLGHGVLPNTPIETVSAMIETVLNYKAEDSVASTSASRLSE